MSFAGSMSETTVDRYSRPLNYNHQPLPSLPSINDLACNLRRCPTCQKLMAETETCANHERRSGSGSGMELAEYQLPRDPFHKNAPMQRRLSYGFPSPVLSAGETSSDSEPMYTPNVSRATSPVNHQHGATTATQQRRRSSKVASRRDSRRESLPLDSISAHSKKIKKMEKEKACRSQQASCLSRSEDFFRNYCSWERVEQSGGNGNGAGLTANKINILRGMEVAGQFFIHQAYCDALKRGPDALEDFKQGMQKLLSAAPDEVPFQHTFLSGSEEPCSHRDPKSKECTTHGTADWRDCRVLQSRARFEEQQTRWMQANIPRAQCEWASL